MKIGILTFHKVLNYGAVLQAYALYEALKAMGHDPFIIDYRQEALKKTYSTFPVGKLFFTPAQLSFLMSWYRFNTFSRRFLMYSAKTYYSLAELKADPPEAEAYICGSDQIWCPRWLGGKYDPAFFLAFGGKFKRISYAASAGDVNELPEPEVFSRLIDGLDHVSVREDRSVSLVKAAGKKDVRCVVDPVFLHPSYEHLFQSTRRPGDFVLVYSLYGMPLLNRTALESSIRLRCTIRSVTRDWKFWRPLGKSEFCISPARWVERIHQARVIVTDSFHATAFSILFHKPFLCILANYSRGGNHRILNLLGQLGLTNRVVYEHDSAEDIFSKLEKPVDWREVDRKVEIMRKDGLDFLASSLEEGGSV